MGHTFRNTPSFYDDGPRIDRSKFKKMRKRQDLSRIRRKTRERRDPENFQNWS